MPRRGSILLRALVHSVRPGSPCFSRPPPCPAARLPSPLSSISNSLRKSSNETTLPASLSSLLSAIRLIRSASAIMSSVSTSPHVGRSAPAAAAARASFMGAARPAPFAARTSLGSASAPPPRASPPPAPMAAGHTGVHKCPLRFAADSAHAKWPAALMHGMEWPTADSPDTLPCERYGFAGAGACAVRGGPATFDLPSPRCARIGRGRNAAGAPECGSGGACMPSPRILARPDGATADISGAG